LLIIIHTVTFGWSDIKKQQWFYGKNMMMVNFKIKHLK